MKRSTPRLAKICRPHLPDLVVRDRLYKLLGNRQENSIIWVTGPPGSGKTSLIAQYIESFCEDTIWYQLDQGDTDVATCFHYMYRAVSGKERVTRPKLPRFAPQYRGDLSMFSRAYFREIFACLDTPFALVFDNYQEVAVQSRFHDVVQSAFQEIPDQGCVICISRTDPPAYTARFIANRQMQLLGWNELRLTREESDAIIKLREQKFSKSDQKLLYEKTQGWAAGLVLMLEAMRREGTSLEIPEGFTPQVVFDYLADEVLRTLEEDHRDFLLRSAILPQVTAKLATELTGNDNALEILDYISNQGYFISANRGYDEVVYQYHPLLRDFLLNRAQQLLSRQERSDLQNQAAVLMERTGHIEDAISLRIENKDWQELAALIRAHAASMLDDGRGETLEQWLDELPIEILDSDPWLVYWLAASKSSFSLREARRLYAKAHGLFKARQQVDVEGLFESCAGVIDTLLFDLDDLTLVDPWIIEVERLLGQYPEFPQQKFGMRVTYNMYLALVFRQPNHPEIEKWAERSYAILQMTDDPTHKLRTAINLASAIIWTGRFKKALEIVDLIRDVADRSEVSPITMATLSYIESLIYLLTGEHESCLKSVREGVEIADTRGVHTWRNSSLINGVGSALGAGDLELAEELLARLDSHALATRRFDSCLHSYCLAWMALLKDNVLDAFHHQRAALRATAEIGVPFFNIIFQLSFAKILFACGDERKGAILLGQIRSNSKSFNNHLLEFMAFLVYAEIALNYGRKASGLRALKYALGIGRAHNFSHTIGWNPRDMAALAVTAMENDIEVDYVKQLVVRRHLMPQVPPLHLNDWPWRYRLSTLGLFSLEQDDSPGQGKLRGRPIELIKVAIAMGGREINVVQITDALWPKIDADYSHRSFNTTLHRLRKLLGADQAILLRDGRLSLNPSYFWIDTWAFEQLLDELTQPRDVDDIEHAAKLASRVLALYRGPFLDGDDAAWLIHARDSWRGRFTRATAEIAQRLIADQQQDAAIAFLQTALEAEGLAEGIYRQLMLCYQQLGRKADAIEVYARCRKTLQSSLGTEPSAETDRILEEISGSQSA